ncbi:MAG: VCBS repeat-containing protein [Deltaproteobacteria bacterium]|nr:VCBS repeat-containing protein [Deltaproteobacteria bacterium]
MRGRATCKWLVLGYAWAGLACSPSGGGSADAGATADVALARDAAIPDGRSPLEAGSVDRGTGDATRADAGPPPPFVPGELGTSAAVLDLDGDGHLDLVVGAPSSSEGARAGAVLIYRGSASGFGSTPAAKLLGETEGDSFGARVAAVGDVDGDGKPELAVSALHATGRMPLSGAVYVYRGGQLPPTRLAKLSGEVALDRFGSSVAGGDLDGDGRSELVVAAPLARGYQLYSGAVYLYRSGKALTDAADVKLGGSAQQGAIGAAALAVGDLTADGLSELLVGTGHSVLVFLGRKDLQQHLASTPEADSEIHGRPLTATGHTGSGFGNALAVAGDLDGDGVGDLVVANPSRTVPDLFTNRGCVYLFRGAKKLPTDILESDPATRLVKLVGEADASQFGASVALVPDVNGGGAPDLVVGARWAAGGQGGTSPVAGKGYLFHTEELLGKGGGEVGASSAVRTLVADTPSGELGGTVAAGPAGSVVLGAPRLEQEKGGAFVFTLKSGQAQRLQTP